MVQIYIHSFIDKMCASNQSVSEVWYRSD